MNTEELLVHDRRQWQRAKRLDARFIDTFAVFVLTLQFKSEVIRQMPTLVVTPQQPECIRIPDLKGPEVENALHKVRPFAPHSQARPPGPEKLTSMLK
jgi:hypothetical protein